jgi:hypothetical protein
MLVDKHKAHRCEHLGVNGMINIKMNIEETGWGSVEWINLAQDRDQ